MLPVKPAGKRASSAHPPLVSRNFSNHYFAVIFLSRHERGISVSCLSLPLVAPLLGKIFPWASFGAAEDEEEPKVWVRLRVLLVPGRPKASSWPPRPGPATATGAGIEVINLTPSAINSSDLGVIMGWG